MSRMRACARPTASGHPRNQRHSICDDKAGKGQGLSWLCEWPCGMRSSLSSGRWRSRGVGGEETWRWHWGCARPLRAPLHLDVLAYSYMTRRALHMCRVRLCSVAEPRILYCRDLTSADLDVTVHAFSCVRLREFGSSSIEFYRARLGVLKSPRSDG